MPIIHISTAFNIELEFEVAPLPKRIVAYAIDFGLMLLYLVCMKYLLYQVLQIPDTSHTGFDILVISIPMLLYSLLSELWMDGQSVGKKLLRIRVISLNGGEPTLGQYLIRWITRFFEWPFLFGYVFLSDTAILVYAFSTGFLGIGVLIAIAATNKSQRIGDLVAGTVVVLTRSAMSVDDTVFMEVQQKGYQPMFPEVMKLSDGDINTIKSVLTQSRKTGNRDMCYRVDQKVKQVLGINGDMLPEVFLEKLLEDYNYLATKE
jgi:uncharacterized RDD family membrane protein YckC